MKNLYKKMHDLMCETEGLEKEISVGFGNNSYRAITERTVLNLIKPLLKKYGLILFPIEVESREHEATYEGSKGQVTRLMTSLVVKYKIVDVETGEYEILSTVGNGSDPQDKGSGKAMTYAYKALLQKTFMLFSGEDTDNEHSDSMSYRINTEGDDAITESDAKVLDLLIQKSSKPDETKDWITKKFNVKELVDLSPAQYVEIMRILNEKAKK